MGRVLLGARLREQRAAAGLSLAALAGASGFSEGYVSDVERGKRGVPLDSLARLCEPLGLLVVDLLAGVWPWGAHARPDGAIEPVDGRRR